MSKIPPRTRELRDVVHHRHALEPDALEVRGELLWTSHVALPQLEPRAAQRVGSVVRSRIARAVVRSTRTSPRETRSRVSTRSPAISACGSASPKALARWIERDRRLIENGVEVGQPTLGLRHAFGYDHEEPRREAARKRRERHGVAGAREPADR